MATVSDQRGAALMTALIALMVLSALGLTLVLFTTTEVAVAGAFRDGQEAMYAAEAVLERAMDDLQFVADWNSVLRGEVRSAFVDGPPSGVRTVGNTLIDLVEETNMINCGRGSACSVAEMAVATDDRPWADNNPTWKLFAYGRLDSLSSVGNAPSGMYVVAWVADNPSENDGDPGTDGLAPGNPGSGVVSVRAVAYGPSGLRRTLEATAGRGTAGGVRMLAWRELR